VGTLIHAFETPVNEAGVNFAKTSMNLNIFILNDFMYIVYIMYRIMKSTLIIIMNLEHGLEILRVRSHTYMVWLRVKWRSA